MLVECKKQIKRGLVASQVLSLTQRLLQARTVILRYHSVQVDPGDPRNPVDQGITHSLSDFSAQMEWLARTYEPITLEEVTAALQGERPMPRRGILITFDDGYLDNYEVAMPVLNRLGLKGAFYVTVNDIEYQQMPWFCKLRRAFAETTRETWQPPFLDRCCPLTDAHERRQAFRLSSEACARLAGTAQEEMLQCIERELGVAPANPSRRLMMNWDEVRDLHRQGHTVGSHTVTHPNMAQVPEVDLIREMHQSKQHLEEKLGAPVHHFSYPSPILQPHWNEQTMACCKEAGYLTAVTSSPGPVLTTSTPMSLTRFPAPQSQDDFKWSVQCGFLGHYS